jgi:hypothetical protein
MSRLGFELQQDPSALWKVFLELRNLWNEIGTQIFATALALSIETAGGSLLVAFMLDIGMDVFIFVVDLVDCFMNPDDTKAWTRVEEDLSTLVLYGAFSGLARILKKLSDAHLTKEIKLPDGTIQKPAKTLRTVIGGAWNEVKVWVKQVMDDFISFISKHLPSKLVTEIKNFLDRIYKYIDNFFKTLPKIGRTFFTYGLPLAIAFYVVIKLNETGIKNTLGVMVEDLVGITMTRLQELAGFEDVPTNQEIELLKKIQRPSDFDSKIQEAHDNAIEKINKSEVKVGVEESIAITSDEIRKEALQFKDKPDEYLDNEVIKYMTGPCKDYFTTLRAKNSIKVVLTVNKKNGKESLVDAFTINGEKGFKVVYDASDKSISVEDSSKNKIDCDKLNKEELKK